MRPIIGGEREAPRWEANDESYEDGWVSSEIGTGGLEILPIIVAPVNFTLGWW